MKKYIVLGLLAFVSGAMYSQCPGAFTVPYVANIENAGVPELPDCMGTNYLTFASDEVFKSIPGPVAGFNGKLLAYDTAAEENGFPFFTGASLSTHPIQLVNGEQYVMSCRFGVNGGTGIVGNFGIALKTAGAGGTSINLAQYANVQGGEIVNFESDAFAVPATGLYYLSFVVDTQANQGFFYIDDIAVQEEGNMGTGSSMFENITVSTDPVSSVMTISGGLQADRFDLYAVTGQRIFGGEIKAPEHQVSMAHLSQGIYLLNIFSNGRTKKIKICKP